VGGDVGGGVCDCAKTVKHATDIASTLAGTNHGYLDRELGFIAGSFSICSIDLCLPDCRAGS
jgi:hypothetical protein